MSPPPILQDTHAKILIVEDEGLIAENLNRLLADSGHEVTGIADSCEQTLQEISKARPDLVLMDVRIHGEMDGIETGEYIGQRFNIPLIYLSGQTDSFTINRAKMTMARGFLPKPVHQITLLASIQMAVHRDRAEQTLRKDRLRLERDAEQLARASLAEVAINRQTEGKLRESEQRLRALVEGVKDYALLMLDVQGKVVSWTACAERIKGYRADEILGKSFKCFYTPDDVDRGHPEEVLRIARDEGHFEEEGWRVRKDGTRFWADVMLTALRDEAGQIHGFSKMTRDITDKQRSRKERNQLIGRLEKALNEKTVLLQEVHHRVKNNLAVIGAFLRMQATSVADERLTPLLEQSQQRVASMALIHEHLYSTDHFSEVNFGSYVNELANELGHSHGMSDRVQASVQVEEIELSIDFAIPCGLILNELLSNAFKYGFPGQQRGNITVKFHRLESGDLVLSCHDDGAGIADGIDWECLPGLGLKIVQILTKQLKGTLSLDRSHGTLFELKFSD